MHQNQSGGQSGADYIALAYRRNEWSKHHLREGRKGETKIRERIGKEQEGKKRKERYFASSH